MASVAGIIVAGFNLSLQIDWYFCLMLFSIWGAYSIGIYIRLTGFDCLFDEEYSDEEIAKIKALMKNGSTFQEAHASVAQQSKEVS